MANAKLRNAGGEKLMGFAQWIGRKIKNHDMCAALDDSSLGSSHRRRKGVSIVPTIGAPVILCELTNGKIYEIQVREVETDAYDKAKRIEVGL